MFGGDSLENGRYGYSEKSSRACGEYRAIRILGQHLDDVGRGEFDVPRNDLDARFDLQGQGLVDAMSDQGEHNGSSSIHFTRE